MGPGARARRVKRGGGGCEPGARRDAGAGLTVALGAAAGGVLEAVAGLFAPLGVGHRAGGARKRGGREERGGKGAGEGAKRNI